MIINTPRAIYFTLILLLLPYSFSSVVTVILFITPLTKTHFHKEEENEETKQRGVAVVVTARNYAGQNPRQDNWLHVRHSPPHLHFPFPSPPPFPHLRFVSFHIFVNYFDFSEYLISLFLFCPHFQVRNSLRIKFPPSPPPLIYHQKKRMTRRAVMKFQPYEIRNYHARFQGVRLYRRRFAVRVQGSHRRMFVKHRR